MFLYRNGCVAQCMNDTLCNVWHKLHISHWVLWVLCRGFGFASYIIWLPLFYWYSVSYSWRFHLYSFQFESIVFQIPHFVVCFAVWSVTSCGYQFGDLRFSLTDIEIRVTFFILIYRTTTWEKTSGKNICSFLSILYW